MKFRFYVLLFLSLFLLNLPACKEKDDTNKVFIIGKSSFHQSKVIEAPRALLQLVMMNTLSRGQKSALKILNENTETSEFYLDQVSLGLQIEAEAGITQKLSLGASGGFELNFLRLPAADSESLN